MPKGRPPASQIDPERPGPIALDVREIDADKRLSIPKSLAAELAWLRPSMPCLMILEEPGRLLLRNWSEHEEPLRLRRRELVDEVEGDGGEAEERLVFFDDKYRRARLDINGRIPLVGVPLVHLLGDRRSRTAFIVRFRDRLEIWSLSYRNRRRRGRVSEDQ